MIRIMSNEEVFIAFEGRIKAQHLDELASALGKLGINSNIRIIETETPDSQPTLEIYDGHLNPDLTSLVEDEDGYTHQILNPNKFLEWSKSTGFVDSRTSGQAFLANRNLATYLFNKFPGGRNFAIRSLGHAYLLKAEEVPNTMDTLAVNPHIMKKAPGLGPKGLAALKEITRHLIIPNESHTTSAAS